MSCAKCGHPHPEGASFCIECGAALNGRTGLPPDATAAPPPLPPPEVSTSEPATGGSPWKWALIVAVVSYALFGSILYLSPETRQEFLVSCECDMSQAIKTLAGLFPVWVLVLRLGRAVFLRVRN